MQLLRKIYRGNCEHIKRFPNLVPEKRTNISDQDLENLIEGPFRYFVKIMGSKLNLKRLLCSKMRARFGQDVVIGAKIRKPRQFKISNKFHLDESAWVTRSSSDEFTSIDELQNYLTGSVISFRREIPPTNIQYFHTGVMLRGAASQTALMELKFEPGKSLDAKVEVNLACNILNSGNNPPGATISVTNKELNGRGVNIAKALYHYSRISGMTVKYDVSKGQF